MIKKYAHLPRQPRGPDGRFFKWKDGCPVCGTGDVICEGEEYNRALWRCDGLIDPEDVNKPLDACPFTYVDGDPILPSRSQQWAVEKTKETLL